MQLKKFDTINVVPFIDIMLVLLVIVLTTASFVARGIIPVDLSEGKSATKLTEQKIVTITIKDTGELFFNKIVTTHNEIEQKLSKLKTSTPISINCDKKAKFENFVKVIDILKLKNFTNLSIVTKQE
ncbi:MAG: biopolymer transporter ExbD [Arcobacteraceae bacterium]|nr:biopolymer transporter ExbD [Arcobacteraceae bacterium]